jgi:hypothetical protein
MFQLRALVVFLHYIVQLMLQKKKIQNFHSAVYQEVIVVSCG